MKQYMTIRELAKEGLLSETELRRRLRAGSLPGVMVGERAKKFMVNTQALIRVLEQESMAAVHG